MEVVDLEEVHVVAEPEVEKETPIQMENDPVETTVASEELVLPVPGKPPLETAVEDDEETETDKEEDEDEEVPRAPSSTPEVATPTGTTVRPRVSSVE